MEIEFIKYAYDFVNDFKYMNVKTKTYNKFDFEYKVPSIKGITKYQWDKDLESVSPSTMEYIIYHLHNAETKITIDTIISYLYYWKIRKADSKMMRTKYKEIVAHYTVKQDSNIPIVIAVPSVYYISFMVGNVKVYKIGYSKEPTRRFKEIISSVKEHYPFVSVGQLELLDIEEYSSEAIGLEAEKKVLDIIKTKEAGREEEAKRLKKRYKSSTTDIFFEGGTEAYNKPLAELI